MALSTPSEIRFLVGGIDVSGDSYTMNFDEENLIEETHTFGDNFEENTPIGLGKFTFATGEGLYDDRAVGMLEAYLEPVTPPQSPNTAPQLVALMLSGDDIGKGTTIFNGTYVTKFNRGAKRDGLTIGMAEHSINSKRIFGHVLHGLDTVTTNSNSEATPADAMFPDPAVDILTSAAGGPGVITTRTYHGLKVGDFAFISGHSGSTPSINSIDGSAGHLVVSVPSAYTFTVGNISVGGTGGTVKRMRSVVITSSNASDIITTAQAHNLMVGDRVFIAGHVGSAPDINSSAYASAEVATVPSATTFTLTGVNITTGGTGGRVARVGINASFADLHVPELFLGDHSGLRVRVRSSFDKLNWSTVGTFTAVTEPGTAQRVATADIGRYRAISWEWEGASVSPSASASPSSSLSASSSASASPSASASSSASASTSPSASASGSPSASASPSASPSATASASTSPSASASPSASVSPTPSASASPSASTSPSASASASPSLGSQEEAVIFVHAELGAVGVVLDAA